MKYEELREGEKSGLDDDDGVKKEMCRNRIEFKDVKVYRSRIEEIQKQMRGECTV